jgi:hypothetical protein
MPVNQPPILSYLTRFFYYSDLIGSLLRDYQTLERNIFRHFYSIITSPYSLLPVTYVFFLLIHSVLLQRLARWLGPCKGKGICGWYGWYTMYLMVLRRLRDSNLLSRNLFCYLLHSYRSKGEKPTMVMLFYLRFPVHIAAAKVLRVYESSRIRRTPREFENMKHASGRSRRQW